MGTIIYYHVTLTVHVWPFFENFNLFDNFSTVSAGADIFQMSILGHLSNVRRALTFSSQERLGQS